MNIEIRGIEAKDKNDTNTGRTAPDRRPVRGGSVHYIKPPEVNRYSVSKVPPKRSRG